MAVTGPPSLADNGTEGSRSFVNKLEPEPQQPPPAAPWHAGWTKAVAAVAGLVVIVATIIGIWGPLWPTAPTFYPETPSAESPLELSFKVKNRSALFPLRNLQIVCMLVSAPTSCSRTSRGRSRRPGSRCRSRLSISPPANPNRTVARST